MTVITYSMYEEAYTLGKRIVDRQLEKPDAIISLSELGMHIKSANSYSLIYKIENIGRN